MTYLLMLLVAVLVFLLPLSAGRKYGRFYISSPLVIVAFSLLIGIGVKTLGNILAPERSFYNKFTLSDTMPINGYIFTLVFVMLMILGYVLSIRKTRRVDNPYQTMRDNALILNDRKVLIVLFASLVVFVGTTAAYSAVHSSGLSLGEVFSIDGLARISREKVDRIEGIDNYGRTYGHIRIFYSLIIFSMLILFNQIYVRKPTPILLLSIAILIMLNFMAAIILGKRTDLIMTIFMLILIHFCYRPRITPKMIATGGLIFVGVLVVFSFMTQARTNASLEDAINLNTLDPIIDQVVYSSYFFDINIISLVIENIKSDEYLYGSSYFDWVISMIPRVIWPDKPPTSLGQYVMVVVMDRPADLGGWVATITGEAFINFGWFGVFLGGAYGMFYRKVEEFLTSAKMLTKFGGPWFYVYFIYQWAWHLPQTSFSIFFGAFIYHTIIAIMVMYAFNVLAQSRSRPHRRPRSAIYEL